MIKRLLLSGFRGIAKPLELSLEGRSLYLYGANGTGKSSLTDAWEWLTTGRISHLAREGAEENSYPNLSALPGQTYVEVQFKDAKFGVVRLTFDEKRPTIPKLSGNLAAVRAAVHHPCHIRYADLTRFVLYRKAQRYDALATLMNFEGHAEYLKALRRIENRIAKDVKDQGRLWLEVNKKHKDHFKAHSGQTPIEALSSQCSDHGYPCDGTRDEIDRCKASILEAIVKDPAAKAVAALGIVRERVAAIQPPSTLSNSILNLKDAISKQNALNLDDKALLSCLPLLEAAETLLKVQRVTGSCPLCNQSFEGDLQAHVSGELARLTKFQSIRREVIAAKSTLQQAVVRRPQPADLPEFTDDLLRPLSDRLAAVVLQEKKLQKIFTTLGEVLGSTSLESVEGVERMTTAHKVTTATIGDLIEARREFLASVDQLKQGLGNDPARRKLVALSEFISKGLSLIDDLAEISEQGTKIKAHLTAFEGMVGRFVQLATSDVSRRFDQISGSVTAFFGILEADTQGLGEPKLKLDPSSDRSVDLEVMFHGSPISPAYRYLSESQLNSFGLAVALASAVYFNGGFSFLLLDDVVNSFDFHKRPRLIELIEKHLGDTQVLLFTHDRLWKDSIARRLKGWQGVEFFGYEFGIGPRQRKGRSAYDRVADAIADDEPATASRELAFYLEDVLTEICDAFEVSLKYNRRNEYTLDPLMDGLRTHLQKKLGSDHPVTQSMQRLCDDTSYRNWATHPKAPSSSTTASEMNIIFTTWKAVEPSFYCGNCGKILKFQKTCFRCECGGTTLTKSAPAPSS